MYTDAELESGADLPFDCRPAAATLDDLNLDFIERHYLPNAIAPDLLAANARTLKHQLRSLRLLNGGNPCGVQP